MAVLAQGHGILFGLMDPAPVIPGYLVIARKGEFLKARDAAGQEHFVRDAGDRWELWLCHYDGRRTPGNPRGETVHDSPPLEIPKS